MLEYAIKGGADSITVHLREDRRHIQERDVRKLKDLLAIPLNLEMALTDEMLQFAINVKPDYVCLVPEKRQELTTEGGLDLIGNSQRIKVACDILMNAGIKVSCFIDPAKEQIDESLRIGNSMVELHTGKYADIELLEEQNKELEKIKRMAIYAASQGLQVNAGHGLNMQNIPAIANIPEITELNIGHSIISRALFIGLENAVREVKQILNQ